MSSWLIYPYQRDCKWLCEKGNNFRYFQELKAVISVCGNDEQTDIRQMIKDENFEEEMKNSEGLWIVNSDFELDFYEHILPKIKCAVSQSKQILCTRDLKEDETKVLSEIILDDKIHYVQINKIAGATPNTIFDIDTPVILSVGMSEKINSIEHILSIQKQFEDKGYSTAVFCDAKEILLFHRCYWLSMFSDKNISQSEKVILANHYIKQKEINDNPDIILISIMSGTATLGRTFVENFGLDVYSIAKAVRPDCVVMNVSFGYYGEKDLELIGEETEVIIGEKIDFFNIVNKVIDLTESEIKNEICTVEIDKKLVEKEIKCFAGNKVFCIGGQFETEQLVEAIIHKLTEYTDVISI